MQQQLPSLTITYNLDLSIWEATSSERLNTITNFDLIRRISRIHYEYQHMNRKIDAQFQLFYSTARALKTYRQLKQFLVDAILLHRDTLEKQSKELVIEIDTELSKLKSKKTNQVNK